VDPVPSSVLRADRIGPAANGFGIARQSSYHLKLTRFLRASCDGFQPAGQHSSAGQKSAPVFYPDTTINYEVGVKSEFSSARAAERCRFDIEWHHIQLLQQFGSCCTAFGNVECWSKGVELSATYNPFQLSRWLANGAYTSFLTTAHWWWD